MSNINIDYKYRSFDEIFESVKNIWNFSIVELSILFLAILLTIALVLYILPILEIIINSYKTQKDKTKKKLSLKRIIITKEIETEIENELKKMQEDVIRNKDI